VKNKLNKHKIYPIKSTISGNNNQAYTNREYGTGRKTKVGSINWHKQTTEKNTYHVNNDKP